VIEMTTEDHAFLRDADELLYGLMIVKRRLLPTYRRVRVHGDDLPLEIVAGLQIEIETNPDGPRPWGVADGGPEFTVEYRDINGNVRHIPYRVEVRSGDA
jgi:hypothetical protein